MGHCPPPLLGAVLLLAGPPVGQTDRFGGQSVSQTDRQSGAMFFCVQNMERHIVLHPAHFGPRMREVLYERLRSEARACCRVCGSPAF